MLKKLCYCGELRSVSADTAAMAVAVNLNENREGHAVLLCVADNRSRLFGAVEQQVELDTAPAQRGNPAELVGRDADGIQQVFIPRRSERLGFCQRGDRGWRTPVFKQVRPGLERTQGFQVRAYRTAQRLDA